jgi:CheY-like chemotaxis protein
MSGKKLLVADDSLTIQKVIRLALSHEGYDIQAVSDGAEAVEQLMLFRPQVVLIDVSLPGKSATEVKAFSDEKPELRDVRFVLMSSAFEQVDEAAVDRAGFHGRLTKPFDPAHLRKVLTDSLQATSAPSTPSQAPVEFPSSWDSPAAPIVAPITPPPFHPAPAAAPAEPPSGESDIRELTQSTLQMAGLDDFGWTVNEGARKPEPAFQPFDLEPSLPPLPNMTLGSAPSQAPKDAVVTTATGSLTLTGFEIPQEPASTGIDSAAIESLVQQQVEAALSKMSREMLPQIAERLIKQEIHRLLGEGP